MQYDVVGFQTQGDARNFIRYLISECSQMREARVFETAGHHVTLSVNGRETLIGDFPVGIEPQMARA
jgi:trehalose-6-phosphate synthase